LTEGSGIHSREREVFIGRYGVIEVQRRGGICPLLGGLLSPRPERRDALKKKQKERVSSHCQWGRFKQNEKEITRLYWGIGKKQQEISKEKTKKEGRAREKVKRSETTVYCN